MTIDIDNCKSIIGVAGITVSQIDNTIFISNEKTAEMGVPGTIAIYADEFGNIKSTGVSIDIESNTLTSNNIIVDTLDSKKIKSTNIVVDTLDNKCITSKLMQSSNIHSNNYYLTIEDENLKNDLFAKLGTYQYKGNYIFGIFVKSNNSEYSTGISIDRALRVSIEDGRLNLRKSRTINSAVGSIGDHPGDIAIDSEYLYYCHAVFDNKTPIWVRWKVSDINW